MTIMGQEKPSLNDVTLMHYGVKGMKWGVRKNRDSGGEGKKSKAERQKWTPEQKKAIAKKAAVGVGTLLAAAGAAYLNQSMQQQGEVTIGRHSKPAAKRGESAVKKILDDEPVAILHAARGKNQGFTFLKDGGIPLSSVEEYERGFGHDGQGMAPDGGFRRYGNSNEKIAARIRDPDGRKDFAGRDMYHDIIVPKTMADGINSADDVATKLWPQLRDDYDTYYNKPER